MGGDFNGDGNSDILIGAPKADPNGLSGSARTYVLNSMLLRCNSTTYLDSNTASCVQNCPSKFWAYPASRSCIACYDLCSACNSSANTECTSCVVGSFLILSNNTCQLCPSECTTTTACQIAISGNLTTHALPNAQVAPTKTQIQIDAIHITAPM